MNPHLTNGNKFMRWHQVTGIQLNIEYKDMKKKKKKKEGNCRAGINCECGAGSSDRLCKVEWTQGHPGPHGVM